MCQRKKIGAHDDYNEDAEISIIFLRFILCKWQKEYWTADREWI